MKIKRILDIFKTSFLVIPVIPGKETDTLKFNLQKILLYIGIYTLVVAILVIFLLSVTPAKDVLFVYESAETIQQAKDMDELREKIIFLTRELNEITSLNKNLKFAAFLGDSTLFDSLKTLNDSLQTEKSDLGGSLLFGFKKFFDKYFSDGFFLKPVEGFVSRGFNPEAGHMGIDFALKMNTPVLASASGYVIFADYTVSDGYIIILAHEDDYITLYKHCGSLTKKMREKVTQGELIALSGNSGYNTTGPHLHFEIWKTGNPIDPTKLINNITR